MLNNLLRLPIGNILFTIINLILIQNLSNAHKYADNYCSFGKFQSPIRISIKRTISLAIPALERIGFENLLPEPIHISNDGHTINFNPPKHSTNMPYIFGGLLLDEYVLHNLHFHWGSRNQKGSEHIINGLRYAAEMHIILRNRRYDDINEAINHRDGLAVLGVLFQAGIKSNSNLEPILKGIKKLNHELRKDNLLEGSFQLSSLLPDLNQFYTYRGSLTTPPCSESVSWFLAAKPIPISYDQLNIFRQVKHSDSFLVDNYRPIQPIRKRNVILRKVGVMNLTAISRHETIDEMPWWWK